MSYRDRSSTASHLDGTQPDAVNAPPPQLQPMTLGLVPEVICRSFGIPSDNAANQYLQRYPYEAPASYQQHPYDRLPHYGDRASHHMAFCAVAPSAQMTAYGHGGPGAYQGLPGYGPHPHMFGHGLNAHMLGGQGFLLPQDMQLHLQQLQQQAQQQQQHHHQQHQQQHVQQQHHHHQQPQSQQQQPTQSHSQQPHEMLSDPHQQHMRQALYAQMQSPEYMGGQPMAMPGRGTKRPNGVSERELPLQPLKRSRVVWTKELHQRFEEALEKAGGIDVAVPKTVLEYMAIPGLTRDNVASHLQKHRIQMKRKDGQQASTATAQRSVQDQEPATTGPSGSLALATDAAKAEPSAAATETDLAAPTHTAPTRANGEALTPSMANDTNTVDNLADKLDTANNGPAMKGVTSGNNGDTSGNMTSESGKTVFLGANFRSPGHATTLGSEETGDATRTRLNGGFRTASNGATTKRMDKCSTLGLNASEREDATSADTGQAVAADRDVPAEHASGFGHAEATYA